ncbi:hypothetical protein [Halobaculum magnesiiphilum]|uniref:Uncharacterized protein n=1 Tax=Halobaculum magnesiiphilum TaxID=1017351 RepID=A0A8T8W951_9EURY|nr:hypothetical protein [Halobaculum magnesiiphilum]QZP36360.1 hypothetical protein K6T50_08410 [Halobaculum magnesiiphilum]
MSTSGPDAVDPEDMNGSDHSDVPADIDGAYLFGISRDGTPFYYDDDRGRVVEGDRHGGVADDHGPVDSAESFIAEVDRGVGWDLLGSADNGG